MVCDTCNILLKTAETKSSNGKVVAGLLVVGGILAVVAVAVAASRNS